MIKYPVAAALVAGGLLVMTACGSSTGSGAASGGATTTASPSAQATASTPAPTAAECGTATPVAGDVVKLAESDDGETLCVNLGTTIEVLLRGTPADKWKSIDSSSELILAPKLEPGMGVPAGWTGTAYEAIRSGTAYVASLRYPCGSASPGTHDMQCGVIQSYRVDITVAS